MRREWRIRLGWLALGFLLGSIPKCVQSLNTDSCLDQGGRMNYEKGECEFKNNT